jgi:hypothetical protein
MDLTVAAKLGVPGLMTEWYPAAGYPRHNVAWRVKVDPVQSKPLPRESGESHYYPARIPSSAMLTTAEGEYDSLLFYRGIATFPLDPVRLEGDVLHTAGNGFVVQRDGSRIGMAPATARVKLPLPPVTTADAEAALLGSLEEAGLTGEEARAMLDVWDDTWFEEGLRVLYVQPRAETDRVLPLTVYPLPDELERVMVGRVEVLTPTILAQARDAPRGPGARARPRRRAVAAGRQLRASGDCGRAVTGA